MKKRIIAIFVSVLMLFGMSSNSMAYDDTVNRSAGSTGYTPSRYKYTGSGTYTCKLLSVSSGAFGSDGGNIIHARIRRTSDNAKAGSLASFTATGQGGYYNYNYGFGDPRYYKLATDDNYNLTYTATFRWSPDIINPL